jgi:hypothetical protein
MGESEAELQRQLAERIRRLDPESYKKAEEFIEGWKRLISDPQYLECPHSCLWRTCIANYSEGAALLGLAVNPQEHRPYAPIRCFAPCVICDREELGGEELRVQGLFDQLGDPAAACEERPERKGDRTKAGDKSPGGGSGGTGDQGQRRARDKGKAKVQDSWATGWLEKGEASRRKKEEKEEVYRKQKLHEERLKKEEEQRPLGHLERFIPEKGEERRERVRKIQEDAEADPEIRAELVGIGRFLVEWES